MDRPSRSRSRSGNARRTARAVIVCVAIPSAGCGGPTSTTQSAPSQKDQVASGSPVSNPVTLFVGGDTPGAIRSLVAWSASPADVREPVFLMDPITEADFAALGPAHTARLEVMMEESKVVRQLAGAAVREARGLAPTDPVRAAQLLDAVERAGFIHRTAGANKLTTMVGEAIEKLAQKTRGELFPPVSGG